MLIMIWLLTAAKRSIMRNPTGALLIGICIHFMCRYITRLSFAWPAVVHPSPPPQRFFPRSSPVVDFPYGDVAGVMSLLNDGIEECLFVMYYAPWCGRSVSARTEFIKAARYLENEVRFVAVNCWYEKGSCREQKQLTQFPAMYFYWIGMEGIKYNGIATSAFIVQFIYLMLNPASRLSNIADVAKTLALSDNCVIGYFDMSMPHNSEEYNQFRYAALRTIERDPKNVINFAVITNKVLASRLGLQNSSSVMMIRALNTSVRFPQGANFSSSVIVHWVFSYRQEPAVKWMLPSGTKSLSLSNELHHGPALIVFLDAKPLTSINYHYTVLRSIAMRYLNCNITLLDNMDAARLVLRHNRALKLKCRTIESEKKSASKQQSAVTRHCCMSVGLCDSCINYHLEHPNSVRPCSQMDIQYADMPIGWRSCVESVRSYNTAEFITNCCGFSSVGNNVSSSSLPNSAGWFSHKRLLRQSVSDEFTTDIGLRQMCRKLRLSPDVADDVWDFDSHTLRSALAGLRCKTNSSVRFYAMDRSSMYGRAILANIIGDEINALSLTPSWSNDTRSPASAALLDLGNQAVYVMHEPITYKSLGQFLLNFTKNALSQFHKSANVPSLSSSDSSSSSNKQSVVEVTSKLFNTIVLDPSKDVVLMYYTSWCGFCKAFSHIYLSLARHFKSVDNLVFARINSASNDLPWHLKVDSYPTLIFFPGGDKSNSVMFPRHLSLTLTNLVLFVHRSASSTFEMRVCRPACVRNNLKIAITSLQQLHRRISRLGRSIKLLQEQLSAELNVSSPAPVDLSMSSLVPQSIETDASPLPSVAGCRHMAVDEDSETVVPDADHVHAETAGINSEHPESNSIPTDIPDLLRNAQVTREDQVNSNGQPKGRMTCEPSRILQWRDDLHLLRRRMYRYQEQLAFVRYVCRSLTSTVLKYPDGHLRKQQWLQFQRERSRFLLKLSNYWDYTSGGGDAETAF